MDDESKIKRCVGGVIYDDKYRIFLCTSPKWEGYIIPGGKIEENETPKDALIREIKEELNIEIKNIEYVGRVKKEASEEFFQNDVSFIFEDFYAKAKSIYVKTNEEITSYGWFTPDDALKLPLVGTLPELIKEYKDKKRG